MKIRVTVFVCSLSLLSGFTCQDSVFNATYGPGIARSVKIVDGGYLVTGVDGSHYEREGFLLKFSHDGSPMWKNTFKYHGIYDSWIEAVFETPQSYQFWGFACPANCFTFWGEADKTTGQAVRSGLCDPDLGNLMSIAHVTDDEYIIYFQNHSQLARVNGQCEFLAKSYIAESGDRFDRIQTIGDKLILTGTYYYEFEPNVWSDTAKILVLEEDGYGWKKLWSYFAPLHLSYPEKLDNIYRFLGARINNDGSYLAVGYNGGLSFGICGFTLFSPEGQLLFNEDFDITYTHCEQAPVIGSDMIAVTGVDGGGTDAFHWIISFPDIPGGTPSTVSYYEVYGSDVGQGSHGITATVPVFDGIFGYVSVGYSKDESYNSQIWVVNTDSDGFAPSPAVDRSGEVEVPQE